MVSGDARSCASRLRVSIAVHGRYSAPLLDVTHKHCGGGDAVRKSGAAATRWLSHCTNFKVTDLQSVAYAKVWRAPCRCATSRVSHAPGRGPFRTYEVSLSSASTKP